MSLVLVFFNEFFFNGIFIVEKTVGHVKVAMGIDSRIYIINTYKAV